MFTTPTLLWNLFYFTIFLTFFNLLTNLLGLHLTLEVNLIAHIIFLSVPVVLLVLHSIQTLSFSRAIFFILLASLTGWIMEVWGLSTGTIFGGHYTYNSNQLSLLSVPIPVILYWAVFIYTGYCIVNSFLYWLKISIPNRRQDNLWLLPLTVIADGLVVVAIDLFMDPLQVQSGTWTWLEGGPYFGVPIGNFVGWFIVTTIVTGVFRTYQYFSLSIKAISNPTIYIMPVIGYGCLAISFILDALNHQLPILAIVGSLLMLPTVIFNLILFTRWKKSKK